MAIPLVLEMWIPEKSVEPTQWAEHGTAVLSIGAAIDGLQGGNPQMGKFCLSHGSR